MRLININDYAFMEAIPTQETHTPSPFSTVPPSPPISISWRWTFNPEVGAFERKYLQRILLVDRFLQTRQRKF